MPDDLFEGFKKHAKEKYGPELERHEKQRKMNEKIGRTRDAEERGAEEAKVRRHATIRAEAQAKVEIEKVRQLEDIRTGTKIRWNGADVDFADWIRQATDKGHIEAATLTEAFRVAAKHFCKKDGRPYAPRNLQQLLNQRTQNQRTLKKSILS